MHGLVGLLDLDIDPNLDTDASSAMSVVVRDLRSFLAESLEF